VLTLHLLVRTAIGTIFDRAPARVRGSLETPGCARSLNSQELTDLALRGDFFGAILVHQGSQKVPILLELSACLFRLHRQRQSRRNAFNEGGEKLPLLVAVVGTHATDQRRHFDVDILAADLDPPDGAVPLPHAGLERIDHILEPERLNTRGRELQEPTTQRLFHRDESRWRRRQEIRQDVVEPRRYRLGQVRAGVRLGPGREPQQR
jgi:hypothetical protein